MRMRIRAVATPLLLFHLNLATAQEPDTPIATAINGSAIENNESSTEGIEYLTRGPLHEAFAEPYSADAVISVLIAKEPPEPIDELPPEFRPDGENVEWIPGYWAWDDEREDYLWISGVWRQMPPNQRWVPGYWTKAANGYQWVAGFWTGIEVAEVQYLPTPPATLEEGPSAPAPAEDYFYIPGNWVYDSGDYRWQPGFWTRTQENWVWSPAQYVWTPRGCIYRQGFWDYDVAYRGVVFTPVYYQQPIYRSAAYTYRPRYTIDTSLGLFVHLFVRPNYGSYYFGDYYGSRYAQQYRPWATTFGQAQTYDPFYAHYRYLPTYREADALTWITTQHRYFETDQKYRPPRTIEAQREFVRANRTTSVAPTVLRLASVGESITNLAQQQDSAFEFRSLAANEMESFRERSAPLRELSQQRRKLEVRVAGDAGSELDPNRLNVDGSADTNANTNAGLRLQLPRFESAASGRTQADAGAETDPANGPLRGRLRDRNSSGATPGNDFSPSIGRPNTADERPDMRDDATRDASAASLNRLREARERRDQAINRNEDPTNAGNDADPLRPAIGTEGDNPRNPLPGLGERMNGAGSNALPNTGIDQPDVSPGQVESGDRASRTLRQRTDAAAEARARTGGQRAPENALRNLGNGVGDLRAGNNAGSAPSPNERTLEGRMRPPRPQDWPAGSMRRGRLAPLPGTPGPATVSPSAIPSDRRQPDAQQPALEGTRDGGRPSSLPTIDGRGPGPRGGATTPPIGRGTFENLERRSEGRGNGLLRGAIRERE